MQFPAPKLVNTWLGVCRDTQRPGLMEILQSCLLIDNSLLSSFNLHSMVTLHHSISLCLDSWSQCILIHQLSWPWRECLLSVCPTFVEKRFFRGKRKKPHAFLNFQRFLGCIFFLFSFVKCYKIVSSTILMGLGISCMTVKKHGKNRCCLFFSFSLKQISSSFHSVFFHPPIFL